jgi:hypothetical protein
MSPPGKGAFGRVALAEVVGDWYSAKAWAIRKYGKAAAAGETIVFIFVEENELGEPSVGLDHST